VSKDIRSLTWAHVMLDTLRGVTTGRVHRGVQEAAAVARARLKPYAVAVACIGAALGLSFLLRDIVDPTGLFLVAVAISTWSTGWQGGLVAAAVATIVFDYFFTQPLYSVLVTPADLPRLMVFTICALVVNWASDARRAAMAGALRATERQFAAVFDDAPVGVAFIDATGHAFKTNRKLHEMFGYTAREFQRFLLTRVMHPPDTDADWNLFAELVRAKRSTYQFDKHCLAKGGRVVWARVTASLVSGDRGEPLFGVVQMEDITDRKRGESELRRNEALLAEMQELSHTGSWRWQPASGTVSFSRGALRIMGLDPEQPTPPLAVIRQRLHPADLDSVDHILGTAARHSGTYAVNVRVVLSADNIRSVRAIGHATVDTFGGREYIGVLMDVTAHPL
jgi:PAS domain S-box-containing protein